MAKKAWNNVYALRQEYNKFQKKWFPIILTWDGSTDDSSRVWVEALCTENGSTYYWDELKTDYTRISRAGTDKCDAEEVKNMVAFFKSSFNTEMHEVKKLRAYHP